MGCSWYSPRSRSASGSHPARAMVAGIRRLATADRAVPLFTNRRRPVELSEWRGALDALRQFHKIAAGSTNREAVPAPRGFLTPAALTSGALADAPLSLPPAGAPDARPDPRPAASSARVAANNAARSLT